jgi:hypothetical protein
MPAHPLKKYQPPDSQILKGMTVPTFVLTIAHPSTLKATGSVEMPRLLMTIDAKISKKTTGIGELLGVRCTRKMRKRELDHTWSTYDCTCGQN